MASTSTANTTNRPDPHKIIGTFRVAELKLFLKSVRASTAGRKKDLQDRATKLVDTENQKIIDTLIEIHENTFPSTVVTLPTKTAPPKPPQSHSTANPPSFHVKHPDVKLKSHAFYQNIDTVYRTTAMESPSYMKKAMTVQFHLTPQHVRHIFDSETTPANYRTQVILRFCKNETSCEQEDYYPGNCYVTINGQSCPIPGYNPNYSMRPDYKRQGKPINITTYIHTSPAVVNTLMISWNHDIIHSQGFCFAIDLMTCLSPADLLQKLKIKGTRSSSVSKAMIRDKLSKDRDSEISTTSLRLTLLCPLSKMRINNPCKSAQCDHLQCFDASTYLQMNERKPKWICPVCDRPAPFSDLLIDGYLLEICEKSNENLIEFNTEGTWNSVDNHKDKVVLLTPPTSIMIMDSPRNDSSNSNPKPPGTTDEPGVIDLTADSDDDEHINIGLPNVNGSANSSPPTGDGETRSRSVSESDSSEDGNPLHLQLLFDLFRDNSYLGGDRDDTSNSSHGFNTHSRSDNSFPQRRFEATSSSFDVNSLIPPAPISGIACPSMLIPPRVPVISQSQVPVISNSQAPHVPDPPLVVHIPRSRLVTSTRSHSSSSREKVMLGKRLHSSLSREKVTLGKRSHSSLSGERTTSGERSHSSLSRERTTSGERSHSSLSREKDTLRERSHSSSSREKGVLRERSHSSTLSREKGILRERSHSLLYREKGTLEEQSHLSSSQKRPHFLGRVNEPSRHRQSAHSRFNDYSSSDNEGNPGLDASSSRKQSRKGSSPKRSFYSRPLYRPSTPTRSNQHANFYSPVTSDSSTDD